MTPDRPVIGMLGDDLKGKKKKEIKVPDFEVEKRTEMGTAEKKKDAKVKKRNITEYLARRMDFW